MLRAHFYITAIADAETTEITLQPKVVNVSPYNEQQSPLEVKLAKVVGTSSTPLQAFMRARIMSIDVEIGVEDFGLCSEYAFTIPKNKYGNATRIIVEAHAEEARTTLIASASADIICTKDAPAFFRGTEWRNTDNFRNGDYLEHDVNGAKSYYMWGFRVSGNTTKAPWDIKLTTDPEYGYWIHATEHQLLVARMFLTKGALIGSSVFNGDYTISQQGVAKVAGSTYQDFESTESKFSPNIVINWLTGKIKALEMIIEGNSIFKGLLEAVSGSFRELVCLDNSGKAACSINFNAREKAMTFSGDIMHQGYHSTEGRSYRFYASDILCRGQLGARYRTCMFVFDDIVQYFTKRPGESPEEFPLTASGGTYNIYIDGSSGVCPSGYPVDEIFFHINSHKNFNLIMHETQRVLMVNANNTQSTVHIYSNGHTYNLNAGEVAEAVKMPKGVVYPDPGNVLGKYVVMGACYDNNW